MAAIVTGTVTRMADAAAEARAVRRGLVEAADGQVLRVVRLVDDLAERGEADALLAPVRARLRVLRPERRMRFARLLFLPLDPLIVGAADWRPDGLLIPRTALAPLASVVQAGLAQIGTGDAARSLESVIEGIRTTDLISIRRVGAAVWPEAPRHLANAALPETWTGRQGLPASSFATLRDAVAFLLGLEARLADLEQPGTAADDIEAALAAMLGAAASQGAQCWGMLVALLLQRFPGAAAPLRAATSNALDKAAKRAADAALDRAAAWIDAAASTRGPPDLIHAADDIARQIALLESLADAPTQRERATALRAALQAGCEAGFDAGLRRGIDARLNEPADPELICELEQDARLLRRMETEARRLGGGPAYDRRLRETAGRVLAADSLDSVDRVRLIEILGGLPLALQAHRMLIAR